MRSNTKVQLDDICITALCSAAGIPSIENITVMGAGEFNAVYAFDSKGKQYALKVAPDSHVPVMTYEKGMMQSEVYWYEQLRRHTKIRVPDVYYTDYSKTVLSSDYFIMERIAGKQMNEMDFAPWEQEDAISKLPQMAAQIHQIKHHGYGYRQNGMYDTWDQALSAMTKAIIQDAAIMGRSCENGERLLGFIKRHREVLKSAPCCMVNFDLWPSNILCKRVNHAIQYTWIDPERSFWGDPMMDFICFETEKPLRDKKLSLRAYDAVAQNLAVIGKAEEIRYAFAQAYLGIIMEVERYYRYLPADEGWKRNDQVCKGLFESAFACLADS